MNIYLKNYLDQREKLIKVHTDTDCCHREKVKDFLHLSYISQLEKEVEWLESQKKCESFENPHVQYGYIYALQLQINLINEALVKIKENKI